MNLPEDFVFSQSALQDYVECPRRFELRYLQGTKWPALQTQSALEFDEIMQKGQIFHHLVHQHAAGATAELIEKTIRDDELRLWWEAYLRWQAATLPEERYPEISLSTSLNGVMLMAKYDLLARTPEGDFLIVDWKTGKSKRPADLATRMQTLVYFVTLAHAGEWLNEDAPISPERIRMIYWFAGDGRAVELGFDVEKLAASEQRLSALIGEIQERGEFPLTEEVRRCRFCVYRSLCERGETAGPIAEMSEENADPMGGFDLDFNQLEEITF
jgi:RecB family exonuclease